MNIDILVNLVSSLSNLGSDINRRSKGLLTEMEIGEYQISILQKDQYYYILIHDTYDNEPFTRYIIDAIIKNFHKDFKKLRLTEQIEYIDKYSDKLSKFFNTMNFPRDLLSDISPLVEQFLVEVNINIDTIFLSDLDNGIVTIWKEPENKNLVKLLLNILSEIYLEKNWLAESKIAGSRPTHELWFIQKIEMTDFAILGRGFYTPLTDRDNFVKQVENLATEIQRMYFNWITTK